MLGMCVSVVCVVMWSSVVCLSVRLSWYPICVLLFVLDVCMLRECDGDGNAGMGDDVGVVAVSAEY